MSSILIIRPGAIGDFIVTLPLLAALRKAHPDAHIEIMGYPRIAELAVGRHYADAVSRFDQPDMGPFFVQGGELPPSLCSHFSGFSLVLGLLSDPEAVLTGNLERAGCGRVVLYSPAPPAGTHIVDHLLRACKPLRIEEPAQAAERMPQAVLMDADRRFAMNLWRVEGIDAPLVLALHPGSGGRQKRWTTDGFAEVARWARKRRQAAILIVSGPADDEPVKALAERVRDLQPLLVSELPLAQLAAVLEKCACFVGNDSGISHLAAAVGTPTVAIFGPTSAARWSPRGKCVAVVEGKATCAPCPDDQRRSCRDPKCIARVKASDVIKAMRELLARGPEDRASLDDEE